MQLAVSAGLGAPKTVVNTEKGNSLPTVDTLERFADVLDIRLIDLFEDGEPGSEIGMTYFRQYLIHEGFPQFYLDDACRLAAYQAHSLSERQAAVPRVRQHVARVKDFIAMSRGVA